MLPPLSENALPRTKVFDWYTTVIDAFSAHDIPIADGTSDMGTALCDVDGLLQIAEYIGAARVITKPIDVALLRHQQVLFQAICANPAVWAGLAMRIQSDVIWKEAVIHLAGKPEPTVEMLRAEPI